MNPVPAVVAPNQRRILYAFGSEAHLILTGAETGGRYCQWIEVTPPGGGPPPHCHTREDEWFYVLEGKFEFFKDGKWAEVSVGTGVFMPKGSVHSFRNAGSSDGRLLITTAPAGFEVFFGRCAEEFQCPGGPDMPRVIAIAAEHGITFAG